MARGARPLSGASPSGPAWNMPCIVLSFAVLFFSGMFIVGPLTDSGGSRPQSLRPSPAAGKNSAGRTAQAGMVPEPHPSCPPVPPGTFHPPSTESQDPPPKPHEALPDVASELPPTIRPSLFARVYGKEPFELTTNKEWELHAIPSNEWADKAERVIAQ
jgi:hypothetical protein